MNYWRGYSAVTFVRNSDRLLSDKCKVNSAWRQASRLLGIQFGPTLVAKMMVPAERQIAFDILACRGVLDPVMNYLDNVSDRETDDGSGLFLFERRAVRTG